MGCAQKKRWRGWLLNGLVLLCLLSIVSGCDSSSDKFSVHKATGSWEGTIGSDTVRALVAPDGVYRMAILDAGGNATGEYAGQLSINQENVGSGWVVLRQNSAMASGQLSFLASSGGITGAIKLDGESLSRPLKLYATADALGPAEQGNVGRRWSVTPQNISDIVVTPGGTISGTLGGNCAYSGSAELISTDWNIYRFTLKIRTVLGELNCQNRGDYDGLAMLVGEPEAKRLWFSGSEVSRALTFSDTWQATQNLPPQVVVVGGTSQQLNVISGVTQVNLNGSGSSDANRDPLTYAWSGVAPDGSPLLFTTPNENRTTFIPVAAGDYAITLTVGDGLVESRFTTTLAVTLIPARFRDNGNGTVTDVTVSPPLVWLRDAGCFSGSVDAATAAIAALADGGCGLTDGSAAGDWHLPNVDELSSLVDTRFDTPALSDTFGLAKWSEGDAFINLAPNGSYWTSTPNPVSPTNNFFINFTIGQRGEGFAGTGLNAWPVRTQRPDELPPAP